MNKKNKTSNKEKIIETDKVINQSENLLILNAAFLNKLLTKEEFLKKRAKLGVKREVKLPTKKENQLVLKTKIKTKKQELNNIYLSNSKQKIVEIINLSKKYKKNDTPALDNISFNIYKGHFHAFIGANGAGKTTTIKAIISAYSQNNYSGKILIDSLSNTDIRSKRKIGYIPEKASFPRGITTLDYLSSMACLSGYSITDSKKISIEILNSLEMSEFLKKKPYNFSSGQKKQILLAQALIHNPDILILDEPAANLDPNARQKLFETLVSLQHQGKAIFVSSHILDEIGKYASFATILDKGKILYDGQIKNSQMLTDLYQELVINKK